MASGTISMGVNGYLEGQIVWSSSSNGSSANSSNVSASLQIRRTNSYTTTGTWTGNLNIGGNNQSYSLHAGVSNSWVTVKSFSVTVGHSDDGSGSCYIQGRVVGPSGTTMAGLTLSAEQTVGLDKIPRYAGITTFAATGQTLNTASFKWATNNNCSKIEYKIGSGSYVNLGQSGTSGTFKISGLTPSSTYKVKLRVTRSDSGLTTESSEVSVTTLAIASITSASDFNIGTSPTIKFTNPSGNAIAVYIEMDTNTNISNGTYTVTGKTEYQFTNVNNSAIYSSIPNANSKSIRYVIRTTEGSNNYYSSVTKTAYVVNSNPTAGSFSYRDNNSTIVGITEDNQRIVRNQSTLLFTIGAGTAKNSAVISKYQVTFNGTTKEITNAGTIDFGKINLTYGQEAELKVIDSRGNSVSTKISVTIDDWVAPTGIISLQRKNNYENETYLLVDGTYSSVHSKNSMTIGYQYKKTTDENYNAETIIRDNTQTTLSLDNRSAWNFKIKVRDRFTETEYNTILPIGKPILFIDALTQKVGINRFPSPDGATLQVEGSVSINDNPILNALYPVGAIYLSVNSTNPSTFFGGTWEQIKDRFLIGAGNTYALNSTGGSTTHTLTTDEIPAHAHGMNSHTHSYTKAIGVQSHTLTVNEIPSHTHQIRWKGGFAGQGSWSLLRRAVSGDSYDGTDASALATGGGGGHNHGLSTSSTNTGAATGNTANAGGGKAHSIMPPYLAVYMWKRTA